MKQFVYILDRICVVIGALLFAQIPPFFAQYLHELSGHIAELAYQINIFEQGAQLSNKTLPQMIQKFLSFSDPDIVHQGKLLQAMVDRWEGFAAAQEALQQASLWTKPFVFLRYMDWGIVKNTMSHYQFGFSLNLEGILYAFIGIIAGYLFFQGIASLFKQRPNV